MVTVIIYTPQEIDHSSYIISGLYDLEKRGIIKLKQKLRISSGRGRIIVDANGKCLFKNILNPKVSFYKIIDEKHPKGIMIAVDLYDAPNHFSRYALDFVDVYFKRNFENEIIDSLEKRFSEKIFKTGLVHSFCLPPIRNKILYLISILTNSILHETKLDRYFFSRILQNFRKQVNHWKIGKSRAPYEYYREPSKGGVRKVMFQTRCFPHDKSLDIQQIHHQRYRLILNLKKELGSFFVGGFIPSPISIEKYSDAITNIPSEQQKYLETLKSISYVVYTRGLNKSPAWKMAEYLSQGKIIIAEELTAELPIPLKDGEHLFFAKSEREITNIAKELIEYSDLDKLDEIRSNAIRYYSKHIAPEENLKRIIDLTLLINT